MNHQWIKQCAFLLVSCCLLPCFASSSTDSNRKTASAAKRLTIKATNGDKVAMRKLGLLHLKGINGKKDTSEAMQWLKKAAKKGDAPAMMHVGDLYRKGSGVNKNTPHAMTYYADCFKAMQTENNGLLCEDSLPVIQRIKKIALKDSIYWWTARCNEGDMHALYYLATLTEDKRAGIINGSMARKYLIKSALNGHPNAKNIIESAPRRQYLTYWKKIIKEGDTTSALSLAREFYNGGNCTDEELQDAEKYFIVAASADNEEAIEWLKLRNPEILIEQKKARNAQYKGKAPKNLAATYKLIEAASRGQYWEFEKLLRDGASINYFDDKMKRSAFACAALIACVDGNMEGLEILTRGSRPDIYHCSNLPESVFSIIHKQDRAYSEKVMSFILDFIDYELLGDLRNKCVDYASPIYICASNGFSTCVKKLLQRGISPHNPAMGRRPVLNAMLLTIADNIPIKNREGFIESFNLIISNGAKLNHVITWRSLKETTYETPLLIAIEYNMHPIIVRLINEGADVNQHIHGDVDTLSYALRHYHPDKETLKILIKAGVRIDNNSEAMSILKKDDELMYIYQNRHRL